MCRFLLGKNGLNVIIVTPFTRQLLAPWQSLNRLVSAACHDNFFLHHLDSFPHFDIFCTSFGGVGKASTLVRLLH